MPPIRRRTPQRRQDVEDLDDDCERHLTKGTAFFGGFGNDRARFEEAWKIHGKRLLAEWIAAHPGSRPFAWWLLDHGKERPVIDTSASGAAWERALRNEAASSEFRKASHFGFLHTGVFPAVQESELGYLRRLGLLTEEERRLDAAGNLAK